VTVGESLTEARHQAGLSVDELSKRTRIRGMVIRSIERDDYEACGGELYVRGYVRAIAGAVGIDAQPLIHEYDQVRETAPAGAMGADLAATRYDLRPFPGDPVETRFDLPAVSKHQPAGEDLMAAGYELSPAAVVEPAGPAVPGRAARVASAGPARERPGTRRGRRGLLAGVAALVVLAVAGTIGIHLTSSSTTSRDTAATSVASAASSASAARASAAAARAAASAKAAKAAKAAKSAQAAKAARPARARRAHHVLPVTALPIAAAEAFGPDGLADGDNPENAHYAIAGSAPLPWTTQWYVTPQFGMLKGGTGLLLDLGRPVTITSIRLDLAQYQGANLQIRIGDSTDPGDLKVAATVKDTGGVLRLTLHRPASARYLLVWFTLLPPNGSGQYEESVSSAGVNGRR
jgi:cytoskeletal protein RodZ